MEWRPVAGYEGMYSVSNTGLIMSHKRNKDKLLALQQNKYGYMQVGLSAHGRVKRKLVHRLVAQAYIKNGTELPFVNHINEIKSDNRVENLEWCTFDYNQNYGTVRQRRAASCDYDEISRKLSKPVIKRCKDGKFLKAYRSVKEAESESGAFAKNIIACCKGRAKTAGGFVWEYVQDTL